MVPGFGVQLRIKILLDFKSFHVFVGSRDIGELLFDLFGILALKCRCATLKISLEIVESCCGSKCRPHLSFTTASRHVGQFQANKLSLGRFLDRSFLVVFLVALDFEILDVLVLGGNL